MWPLIISSSAVGIVLAFYYHWAMPLRPMLAFWFLLVCPGMAYVPLVRLRNSVLELVLGAGLSLSVVTLLALVMLYRQTWSVATALHILVGWSLVGALLQLVTGWLGNDGQSQTRVWFHRSTQRHEPDASRSVRRAKLIDWLKSNQDLLANAGSMVGTTIVTSGLGFVYWWLAAQLFTAEAVGLAAAMISAMMLLATMSVMGLGTVLIGELPRRPGRKPALISLALLCAGGISLILGSSFALLAHLITPELGVLSHNPLWATVFTIGVIATAMLLLLDNALIGLLRGELQLWRNALQAIAKIVLLAGALLVPTGWNWQNLYLAWIVSGMLSVVTLIQPRHMNSYFFSALRPEWSALRAFRQTSFSHFAFNLTLQSPALILPLLVTAIFSAAINASFYVAFSIAGVTFIVPAALTSVLHAIGAGQPARLSQQLRLSLKLSLLAGLGACAVILPGAELVLGFFGASYAEEAAWCLRIFTLGFFPIIIKTHYVAICRVNNRIINGLWLVGAGAILELGLAYVGGRSGGLTGLSLGWLVAVVIQAVIMSGTVFTTMRGSLTPANAPLAHVGSDVLSAGRKP